MNFRNIVFIFFSFIFFSPTQAAETCNAVFLGGLQSHSSNGLIHMGYKSRVYSGGSDGAQLNSPKVTHSNNSPSNPEHSGLCNGQKCTASGTHSEPWNITFETGTGQNGNLGTGSDKEPSLNVIAGDYARFNLGQEAVARFITENGRYRFKNFRAGYKSVLELGAGDYWVDGDLLLSNEVKIRFLGAAGQQVRIFASGKITVNWSAMFEGFSDGQLIFYSKSDIIFDSRVPVKAMLYAVNKVTLDYTAKLSGSISAKEIQVGQEAEVTYIGKDLVDSACGGQVPIDPADPVECDVLLEVGPMIAGMSHFATVTALDEPLSCETPQVLRFLFNYINPDPRPGYHNPLPIFINGKEIAEGESEEIPGVEWEGKEAKLTIEYKEAGRLYLALLDANKQVVSESKDNFVSRPYGLCLETDLKHDEELLFKGKDGGEPIHSAGDDFDLRIRAVAWREDAKSIDDMREAEAICGNPLLLNYRQYFDEEAGWESIKLEAVLIDPELEGGAPEITLGRATHDHTDYGQMTLPDQSISEVGIFMIKAKPPKYLEADMTHATSLSSRIGRFVPAWLEVNATLSQDVGCTHPSLPAENFTYQGQPTSLTGTLEVQGFNKIGELTKNYKGDFWRFSGKLKANVEDGQELKRYDFRQIFFTPGQESASIDRISSPPIFKAKPDSAAFHLTNEEGEFISTYNYSYARPAIPSDRDNPFRLELVVKDWHDLDDVYFRTAGEPPASGWGAGAPSMPVSALIANSEFRLGRIRTENAIHTGLGESPVTVDVPLFLEHWKGGRFKADADGCTDIESVVVSHTGNLITSEIIVDPVDFSSFPPVESVEVSLSREGDSLKGTATLKHLLTKKVTAEKPYWLCQEGMPVQGGICTYSRNEAGTVEEVRADATVTFGIYKGPQPLIFRREVYR